MLYFIIVIIMGPVNVDSKQIEAEFDSIYLFYYLKFL